MTESKSVRHDRRGIPASDNQSKNKNAAAGFRGGVLLKTSLKSLFRPWQAWQRPTLPSLET